MTTEVETDKTTLDDLVKSSIQKAIHSQRITDHVTQAAEKAVKDAVESALGRSSDFQKGLREAISAVLSIPDATDLAVFSNAVRTVVQQRLGNLADETAKASLDEVLEAILPSKQVITMAELRDAWRVKLRRDKGIYDEEDEEEDEENCSYLWQVEASNEHSTRHYWDLFINANESASRYDSGTITLRFRHERDSHQSLCECWHAACGSTQIGSLFVGPLYGFDALVFRLAVKTSKLRRD